MNTDKAWDIYEALLDDYFRIRKELQNKFEYTQAQVDSIIESTSNAASKSTAEAITFAITTIFDNMVKNNIGINNVKELASTINVKEMPKNNHNKNGKTITEITKKYKKLSAVKLNNILELAGIQYKINGVWDVYPYYYEQGYVRYNFGKSKDGNTYRNMRWTDKGEKFIQGLLKERMDLNVGDVYDETVKQQMGKIVELKSVKAN